MKAWLPVRFASALLVVCIVPAVLAQGPGFGVNRLAPYVPSPPPVVERMLTLADVTEQDTVYDLGSGDGRIVVMAARQFGAQAVGVEIDEKLVDRARARIKELELDDRARILQQDLMRVDLSPALCRNALPAVDLEQETPAQPRARPASGFACGFA